MSQSTRHRDLRHNKEVVVEEEEQQQDARESSGGSAAAASVAATVQDPSPDVDGDPSERAQLVQRLVGVGVADSQARSLIAEHPGRQIVDVLNAVEVTEVHSPAGWVVTAIRECWDVSQAAQQLRSERDARRLRARDGALRRLAREHQDRQLDRSSQWEAAVSAALDDGQLTAALESRTAPLAGVVGRRSVPVATAQLVGWAVAAHRAQPDLALTELLPRRLLADGATRSPMSDGSVAATREPPAGAEPLVEPPDHDVPAEPLRARVARLVPALDNPSTERARTASRSLEPR